MCMLLQLGGAVNEEMRELLGRVTELQREKWELEERVRPPPHNYHVVISWMCLWCAVEAQQAGLFACCGFTCRSLLRYIVSS